MSRTALFCIDIQHALCGAPSTQIPHANRIHTAAHTLLTAARQRIDTARQQNRVSQLDIITVQHWETADKGALQRGSSAWTLTFAPRADDANERLVEKDVRDTFAANPRLAAELRARGVGTVVAFGIQSECCVLATCRGALGEGFDVVLLSGAHSTFDGGEGRGAGEIEREVEGVVRGEGARVVEWEVWVGGLMYG